MVALRAEKRALRKTLRSFETAFSEKHGRVVQTPADMQPRLQEYQRYKVGPGLCTHAMRARSDLRFSAHAPRRRRALLTQ